VYTLHDMREFSQKQGWCPYFVARHAITLANVVVYNYGYLLDPKIAALISNTLAKVSAPSPVICVGCFDWDPPMSRLLLPRRWHRRARSRSWCSTRHTTSTTSASRCRPPRGMHHRVD
jgi:hypothetical protein